MNTATTAPTRPAAGLHDRTCSHVTPTARAFCPVRVIAAPARPTANR